ncbi:MAG: alpha/beta hydrolase [Armatimonadetes bacterium]|nr:alpha/beta hydrolase [Armatimonadota bacterium]
MALWSIVAMTALSIGGVREVKDLAYVTAPQVDPKQHLDVYVPEGEEPEHGWPVFVFLHGGGWVMGDRSLYGYLGRAIAGAGFLTVCPSYRLSPQVRHPEHAKDAAAALKWVQDHIAEYGGDPQRLVVGGHSAGGHLCSLVTLDRHYLTDIGGDPTLIRGVAALSGVYDLRRMAKIRFLRESMILKAFGDDEEAWKAASPVTCVRADAPPFWLNNAEMDFGLERDAVAFDAALKAAGVAVERTVTRDTNHISEITRVGQAGDQTTERLLEFLRRVTGG